MKRGKSNGDMYVSPYLVTKRYDANKSLCQGSHNPCVPAKVTYPNNSLYPYRAYSTPMICTVPMIHMRKTE